MKTVNESALQQQLNAARTGTPEEQKAYLQALNTPSDELCVVLNTMMNDDDLNWLKPLALELFLPAVDIVFEGMGRKCKVWEQEFLDEDTNEMVPVLRREVIDAKTIFTPDPEFELQMHNRISDSLKELDTKKLADLYNWGSLPWNTRTMIDDELYNRDYHAAIERRGDLYRWGDEENGVFINYATAKQYYDRCGVEFDPVEEARYNREYCTELFPDCATYHIEGPGTNIVKEMVDLLYKRFGEHTEPFMYIPLEAMIKTLVGSSAYIGYIQTMNEVENKPDAIELEVEFYGCSPNCLKYALQYSLQELYPDLKVEFTEHDP